MNYLSANPHMIGIFILLVSVLIAIIGNILQQIGETARVWLKHFFKNKTKFKFRKEKREIILKLKNINIQYDMAGQEYHNTVDMYECFTKNRETFNKKYRLEIAAKTLHLNMDDEKIKNFLHDKALFDKNKMDSAFKLLEEIKLDTQFYYSEDIDLTTREKIKNHIRKELGAFSIFKKIKRIVTKKKEK